MQQAYGQSARDAGDGERGRRAPLRGGLLHGCLTLALVFSAGGASCSRQLRNPFGPYAPPAPQVLVTGSSLDQVIAAVNQNAAKIQSLQTTNASITVPGMPGVPLLRGDIAAQRTSRLRIRASTALTGSEVDLGSNEELFWFWVKRSEPPALYFARHEQFVGGPAQRMLPIEPQWLLDALGFAQFDPAGAHEGPRLVEKGRLEIKSTVPSARGPLTKRTVVDAQTACVLEQHVYDAQGTRLASAVATSHSYLPEVGVSVPQEIQITIPASELSLSIDMGTVAVNSLAENPLLWQMPTIPGVAAIDIGSATPASAVAPPLGDQLTRADWYGPGPAVGATPAAPPSAPLVNVLPPSPAPVASASLSSPSAWPSQQLAPGGVAAPVATATRDFAPGAQRLPVGGVATTPSLAR
jgi:hypothetical protein